MLNYCPQVPHLTSFDSVVQTIKVFCSFTGYNSEFQRTELKCSTILNVVLWGWLGGKCEESLNTWLRFLGVVAIWSFHCHWSHVNENENKKKKSKKSQTYFCEDRWEDCSRETLPISAAICRSSLLEIVLSEKWQVHQMNSKLHWTL